MELRARNVREDVELGVADRIFDWRGSSRPHVADLERQEARGDLL
jgi:hypothetical protein